jgi:MoaA/NifB/PqqE/SkfB family radical SAM enzyme
VSFEVTHSCNAKCTHCHLGGPVNEKRASPQELGRRSREVKPLVAQISGGEPLLRRDLEDIIREIKSPQDVPYIILTTNGATLSRERYESLIQAGVDEFSLSLDYPDERHDEFRRIPGLFRRLETLTKSLPSGNDKAIVLSCVVQSDNYKDLINIAELARDWGVKLNFSTYTSLRTHDKKLLLNEKQREEFKEIIRRLLDYKKKHGVVLTSRYVFKRMVEFFRNQEAPHCRTGYNYLNVNPDGTLSPCGLIIKDYQNRKELIKNFSKNSTCTYCYTSLRANSEKPLRYLITDSLKAIK